MAGNTQSKPFLFLLRDGDLEPVSDSEGEQRHQLQLQQRRYARANNPPRGDDGSLSQHRRRITEFNDRLRGIDNFPKSTGTQTSSSWLVTTGTQTSSSWQVETETQTSSFWQVETETQTKFKDE
jgi:hypothetical protein